MAPLFRFTAQDSYSLTCDRDDGICGCSYLLMFPHLYWESIFCIITNCSLVRVGCRCLIANRILNSRAPRPAHWYTGSPKTFGDLSPNPYWINHSKGIDTVTDFVVRHIVVSNSPVTAWRHRPSLCKLAFAKSEFATLLGSGIVCPAHSRQAPSLHMILKNMALAGDHMVAVVHSKPLPLSLVIRCSTYTKQRRHHIAQLFSSKLFPISTRPDPLRQ